MSATIHHLLERIYKPDTDTVMRLLAVAENAENGGERLNHVDIAENMLDMARNCARHKTPHHAQATVNCVAVAYVALAKFLGDLEPSF